MRVSLKFVISLRGSEANVTVIRVATRSRHSLASRTVGWCLVLHLGDAVTIRKALGSNS